MSHTLKPATLPAGLRHDRDARAYHLGPLHITLSRAMGIPNYRGRVLSVSVRQEARYPTVEEIAEVIVKVPEISADTEWSMLWFGDGSIGPTSSPNAYLFEGDQGRPMPNPKARWPR